VVGGTGDGVCTAVTVSLIVGFAVIGDTVGTKFGLVG